MLKIFLSFITHWKLGRRRFKKLRTILLSTQIFWSSNYSRLFVINLRTITKKDFRYSRSMKAYLVLRTGQKLPGLFHPYLLQLKNFLLITREYVLWVLLVQMMELYIPCSRKSTSPRKTRWNLLDILGRRTMELNFASSGTIAAFIKLREFLSLFKNSNVSRPLRMFLTALTIMELNIFGHKQNKSSEEDLLTWNWKV